MGIVKSGLRLVAGAAVLIFGALVLLTNCVSFSMKPREVDAYFANRSAQPRFHHFDFEGRNIHWVETGDRSKPLVLFVHGSPGAWDAFIAFMVSDPLLEHVRIAAIDRPGFGQSERGKHEPSLAKQAAVLKKIIDTAGDQPVILVGHSYGGPVITRAAMDFPEDVDGLILVAASIDPELEKTKWFQYPAEWALFSWLVPKDLRVSNREILALKSELEAMLPLWSAVTVPTTVIQGEADTLVPAGNADFAAKHLTHAPLEMVRLENLNHFVPWQRPDLIRKAILHQVSALKKAPTTSGAAGASFKSQ